MITLVEYINENIDDNILHKYDLDYIFNNLNEDTDSKIIQNFKKPIIRVLNKIKQKFGEQSSKCVSDIIKNAAKQSKKTLISTLTSIILLSSTSPALGNVTKDFDDDFAKSFCTSTIKMSNAQGFSNADIKKLGIDDDAAETYALLLTLLEDDDKCLYACSGVGCSEDEETAKKESYNNAVKELKSKYGENAITKYDIKFKIVKTQSFNSKGTLGNKQYYTVITVAYQNI